MTNSYPFAQANPNIEELNLSTCKAITFEEFNVGLKSLKKLKLNKIPISDSGLQNLLRGSVGLKVLSLSSCTKINTNPRK
jgi:hypothetical protein